MSHPRSFSIRSLAVAALAVLTFAGPAASSVQAVAGSPAPRQADPGTSTFGIQPKPHDKNDTRAWFSVGATTGAISHDTALASNYGDKPLTLHVYVADALNNAEGAFDVQPASAAPKDAGAWVKFDNVKPFVTIPPRSQLELPFTLSVPANATPGDHAAGIMIALTTPSVDSHGNRVNVEQRVGSRVYVRVAGALKAQMDVSSISADYHGSLNPFGSGSATVTYKITNAGNVRLGAKQTVRVSSLIGGPSDSEPLGNIEELLPGNSIEVTAKVHGVTPFFAATARVGVDPVARPGDLDPQMVGLSRSASMVAIPWSALILLILLAAGGYLVYRMRRRAPRPAKPVDKSSGSKPTPSPVA